MPDFIRQPEKLDTGSEAGMTKASGTEAVPRDNINRSRAAQAAEPGVNAIRDTRYEHALSEAEGFKITEKCCP